MTPDIRRLQVLNDLVAQTIDIINQRAALTGGLSHSPYTQDVAPSVYAWMAQNPQLTTSIFAPFGAQVPFGMPGQGGLQHTPFMGQPTGVLGLNPMWGPMGIPGMTGGLSHTGVPFAGQLGTGFGTQGVGIHPFQALQGQVGFGSMMGGLSHTGMPFQGNTGYGAQGFGAQGVNPLQALQTQFGFGGLSHTPFTPYVDPRLVGQLMNPWTSRFTGGMYW